MSEKPQIELADIQEPSENKSEGLEIARTPELENVVAEANELAEAIKQDRNVTGEEVLNLDKDLGELKFDVCGEQMTVAEIREIPDLQHNLKIWIKISRNREFDWKMPHERLTYLIPSVARILVNKYNTENQEMIEKAGLRPGGGYPQLAELSMSSIKDIPIGVAKELKNFGYSTLKLGCEKISDKALHELCQSKCSYLELGITNLSSSQAQSLAQFSGAIKLYKLKRLSDSAAQLIGRHKNNVWLDDLEFISDQALKYLDKTISLTFDLEERRKKIKK